MAILKVGKDVTLLEEKEHVYSEVTKSDRFLRENSDMYTVMVGKIFKLPREKGTWLYYGDVAILRGRGYIEGMWLY